jgi:hypothetical protein
MAELTAKRTLVKSPPELWQELSEVERLAKHLGAFGEIKISKLDPEHTVAWEGEHASGTVSIEPSGWGTRVTLTAELAAASAEPAAAEALAEPEAQAEAPAAAEPGAEAAAAAEPEAKAPAGPRPEAPAEPGPPPSRPARRWRIFWRRVFSGWLVPDERLHPPTSREPAPSPVEPAPPEPVAPAPEPQEPALALDEDPPTAIDRDHAESVLNETLDALGSAHHRPFSRP